MAMKALFCTKGGKDSVLFKGTSCDDYIRNVYHHARLRMLGECTIDVRALPLYHESKDRITQAISEMGYGCAVRLMFTTGKRLRRGVYIYSNAKRVSDYFAGSLFRHGLYVNKPCYDRVPGHSFVHELCCPAFSIVLGDVTNRDDVCDLPSYEGLADSLSDIILRIKRFKRYRLTT